MHLLSLSLPSIARSVVAETIFRSHSSLICLRQQWSSSRETLVFVCFSVRVPLLAEVGRAGADVGVCIPVAFGKSFNLNGAVRYFNT